MHLKKQVPDRWIVSNPLVKSASESNSQGPTFCDRILDGCSGSVVAGQVWKNDLVQHLVCVLLFARELKLDNEVPQSRI